VVGAAVETIRADIVFRGLVVPTGSHRVAMRFQPAILPVSFAISLATALLLGGLAAWPRIKRPVRARNTTTQVPRRLHGE
jgi:uncharacterized membrane protein YfhO